MYSDYPESKGERIDRFMSNLRQESLKEHNVAYTENGAKAYGTTGKALLDLNFSVSSLRAANEQEILEKWLAAAEEDYTLALKWLFYVRDVREGQGERRLFRTIFRYIVTHTDPFKTMRLISLVPMYGRWDDLLDLFNTTLETMMLRHISKTLQEDITRMRLNQPTTLLAKWLPSINTTSSESRHQASQIARYMGMSIPAYRKTLSKLRSYMDVVEVKMTDGRWDEIDYSRVPGRANLLYSNAFLRHDPDRRREFLDAVLSGHEKVNVGTVYPHEIVHKIFVSSGLSLNNDEIMSIRALWENLPKLEGNLGRTIVVADGSGSMKQRAGGKSSSVSCLEVSIALAIWFSEQLRGAFRNRFITFSRCPQLIDLTTCDNIFSKVKRVSIYNRAENTNIEAVFQLILQTAINNRMSQDELPENILVLSDMEFDSCAVKDDEEYVDEYLFEVIKPQYARYGYQMPRVCFWNIAGRSGAIPMMHNDLGVALMSGFSINNTKLIMSGKLDPYEALVDILNSERYSDVYFDPIP